MKNSKLHTIKQYKNFFFGKTVIVTGHTGFKDLGLVTYYGYLALKS